MSRFADKKLNEILPYVPGEQPQDKKYIKLNTNENPYFVSKKAIEAVNVRLLEDLRKYSDPECKILVNAIAKYYGVKAENVLATNGSDEALAFAFQAYGKNGVCFADVTYGFYKVFAKFYDCPTSIIPLKEDFTIDASDYFNSEKTVVIANPNAQTGISLSEDELESIIKNNKDNVVIVDQAYADFNNYNIIPLINKYDNLVIINTFSKSRSLAGARVGYILANEKLIEDLNKVKYSFHPYNINSLSMVLATNAIDDDLSFKTSVNAIKESRELLTIGLKHLGFNVLPSSANFVLAESDKICGKNLYLQLKERGVLVRHFDEQRIENYVRITIGTNKEIEVLLNCISDILKEIK